MSTHVMEPSRAHCGNTYRGDEHEQHRHKVDRKNECKVPRRVSHHGIQDARHPWIPVRSLSPSTDKDDQEYKNVYGATIRDASELLRLNHGGCENVPKNIPEL